MNDTDIPKLHAAIVNIMAVLNLPDVEYDPDWDDLQQALCSARRELELAIKDLEQQAAHSRGEGMN